MRYQIAVASALTCLANIGFAQGSSGSGAIVSATTSPTTVTWTIDDKGMAFANQYNSYILPADVTFGTAMGGIIVNSRLPLLYAGTNPGTLNGAAIANAFTTDNQLLTAIHKANMAEVADGKLAVRKARSSAVKNYARMMIKEHSSMDAKVRALIGNGGLMLDESSHPAMNEMRRVESNGAFLLTNQPNGKQFEKAYLADQIADHEMVLSMLQTASGKIQNADLRALVNEAIPHVQQHLDRARSLAGVSQ